MKLVILAGGLGTRLSEETYLKPKPMVQIGSKPILWHIMKFYSFYGINDFIICCGYKGYLIKEYFANYFMHNSDVTFSLSNNETKVHRSVVDPWEVSLIDTGEKTFTGGRIKRINDYVKDDKFFCMTYGDGLSNVNIIELIKYHNKMGKKATLTAVRPQARFGGVSVDSSGIVDSFQEKPVNQKNWINGGFFVLSPTVIDKIDDDATVWEEGPLKSLVDDGELAAFKHEGFWQPMDTIREKNLLNNLWNNDKAPWKVW
tara:strand:+ start:36 stop:809 length:774 start_codon:yes stop_codon:yes gene_type:complete